MRNARVWRYFLRSFMWPVAIAAYAVVGWTASIYAEFLFTGGFVLGAMVFLVFPLLAFQIRDMWRDAKQKVADENEEVMRVLRK